MGQPCPTVRNFSSIFQIQNVLFFGDLPYSTQRNFKLIQLKNCLQNFEYQLKKKSGLKTKIRGRRGREEDIFQAAY